MSRPMLCYGQTVCQFYGQYSLLLSYFKNPTCKADLSKFGCVTSSLLKCDELAVWRVDCVTTRSRDELTGSRRACSSSPFWTTRTSSPRVVRPNAAVDAHRCCDLTWVSELEFNVPFQHRHGYIRDEVWSYVTSCRTQRSERFERGNGKTTVLKFLVYALHVRLWRMFRFIGRPKNRRVHETIHFLRNFVLEVLAMDRS